MVESVLWVYNNDIICIGNGIGYVGPVIQIVTNPLLIHYCIPYTTYTVTNYNVIIATKATEYWK